MSVIGLFVNLIGLFCFSHAHHGHSHGQDCQNGHAHKHNHHHANSHEPNHNHNSHDKCNGHSNNLQTKNNVNNDHHQHHHGEDANMRGVFLHILSDTLGSVAVIVTSLLVTNYNCYRVDSVCSIGVSLLTLYMSTELFGQTINSLLKKGLVDSKTDYFNATNVIINAFFIPYLYYILHTSSVRNGLISNLTKHLEDLTL